MSQIDNNSNIIQSCNILGNINPSRRLNRTYIQGFLDVSGGNILLRNRGLFTQTDISSNGNLYIDNTYVKGNVGIGTLTPSYFLDVSGNFNVSQNSIFNGNVGIGTLTPSYSLDVKVIEQIFKLTDGQNRRGVDSSIIIKLNQGQGFYYASIWVGNSIVFCYFGGKLEETI